MNSDIVIDVACGKYDDALDNIIAAAQSRKKNLAQAATADLRPGDTITLSESCRPKYLVGKTAKVERLNPKSVVVSFPNDPTYRRFSGASDVRCPNSIIGGKVEEAVS